MTYGSVEPQIVDLNLDDLFLKYGFIIRKELIQDLRCVRLTNKNNPDQLAGENELTISYFPFLQPNQSHPATRNLDLILGKFVSPIDDRPERPLLQKIPLLYTSQYTKLGSVPATISLKNMGREVPEEFTRRFVPTGLLLEGTFESPFANRGIDIYFQNKAPAIKAQSAPTKMIVLSDGDLIRNELRSSRDGRVVPRDLEPQTRNFLQNLIEYMSGDQDRLALRSRQFQLRLLDAEKVEKERTKWILLNMVIPSLLVLLLGGLFLYGRKTRFSK
jgi:ABC-2 type transport system permease protein